MLEAVMYTLCQALCCCTTSIALLFWSMLCYPQTSVVLRSLLAPGRGLLGSSGTEPKSAPFCYLTSVALPVQEKVVAELREQADRVKAQLERSEWLGQQLSKGFAVAMRALTNNQVNALLSWVAHSLRKRPPRALKPLLGLRKPVLELRSQHAGQMVSAYMS